MRPRAGMVGVQFCLRRQKLEVYPRTRGWRGGYQFRQLAKCSVCPRAPGGNSVSFGNSEAACTHARLGGTRKSGHMAEIPSISPSRAWGELQKTTLGRNCGTPACERGGTHNRDACYWCKRTSSTRCRDRQGRRQCTVYHSVQSGGRPTFNEDMHSALSARGRWSFRIDPKVSRGRGGRCLTILAMRPRARLEQTGNFSEVAIASGYMRPRARVGWGNSNGQLVLC